MNNIYKAILGSTLILALPLFIQSCSPADGNHPGHEYMPDMGHSVAYEANVYNDYSLHTWDDQSSVHLKDVSGPRMPVKGTIPRGYVGIAGRENNYESVMNTLMGANSTQGIRTPINGNVPYYYENTEEERVRAAREITKNPFPMTAKGLAHGKEVYDIYCGICHGKDGGGNGDLVNRDDAKYPAQPANFLQDTFYNSNAGRFFHGIMYGKNVMGGYADKLSYEERWQVIHYIRSLQAKAKGLHYGVDTIVTFRPNEVVLKMTTPVLTTPTTTVKDKEVPAIMHEGHTTGGASHGKHK